MVGEDIGSLVGTVDGCGTGAFDGVAVGLLKGELLCRNDGFVDGGMIDEGAPLGAFEVANPLGLVQGTGMH